MIAARSGRTDITHVLLEEGSHADLDIQENVGFLMTRRCLQCCWFESHPEQLFFFPWKKELSWLQLHSLCVDLVVDMHMLCTADWRMGGSPFLC